MCRYSHRKQDSKRKTTGKIEFDAVQLENLLITDKPRKTICNLPLWRVHELVETFSSRPLKSLKKLGKKFQDNSQISMNKLQGLKFAMLFFVFFVFPENFPSITRIHLGTSP